MFIITLQKYIFEGFINITSAFNQHQKHTNFFLPDSQRPTSLTAFRMHATTYFSSFSLYPGSVVIESLLFRRYCCALRSCRIFFPANFFSTGLLTLGASFSLLELSSLEPFSSSLDSASRPVPGRSSPASCWSSAPSSAIVRPASCCVFPLFCGGGVVASLLLDPPCSQASEAGRFDVSGRRLSCVALLELCNGSSTLESLSQKKC